MTTSNRNTLIEKIRNFPSQLDTLLKGLSDEQLTTPYLSGEWTVAQNVHHLADSHMNSYIRMKLILTENHPTLKPYNQDAWALTPEAQSDRIETSLMILHGLHKRWVELFESLAEEDWSRSGFHAENGEMSIADILRIYADHCDAHLDQIRRTLAAAN
ncbi:MAG: putative metal-dependent hydrolase [Anaerolineales bacterium]|nr:putative metal-dependent hydrolase [Anaerolineales bacterium]